MSNFKTHGEAMQFCKKYGFRVPGNLDAFEIAEAFLRAYNDGASQLNAKADVKKGADHSKQHWSGYLPD